MAIIQCTRTKCEKPSLPVERQSSEEQKNDTDHSKHESDIYQCRIATVSRAVKKWQKPGAKKCYQGDEGKSEYSGNVRRNEPIWEFSLVIAHEHSPIQPL